MEIAIPPGSAYVGIVRLAVGSLARSAGFDEERVDEVRIAVSEACTNAVLTNEEAGSSDPITIAWHEDDDRVVVEVGDRGASPEPDQGMADSQGFSSRMMMSVALLREMVDDLSFDAREGGGTSTRLVFSRPS